MKKNICFILLIAALLINGCGSQAKMKDGFIRQRCLIIHMAGRNIFASW